MSYCINPKCFGRENFDSADKCQTCGTPLLINGRYRIVCPLREPDPAHPTDLFEVRDWGLEAEDWGAVKVMKVLKYTNNPELVRLFKREARTLMWLRDPGIPMVEPDGYFTVAIDKGSKLLHCLVMEKIEGQDLDDWIELNGPISPDEAIAWLKQLVQILDRLHERSLFHRDIKPSNLIVRPNGQLGLIDFGTVGIEESHKTRVGTSGYAAPEQLLGNGEARSDFFALGRTFVYLLSGVPPMNFPESKKGNLLWKNSVSHLPKILVDFVDRLMEPMLERRPKNTQLLLKQVSRLDRDIDLFILGSWSQERYKAIQAALKWLTIGGCVFVGFRFISPAIPIALNCISQNGSIDLCLNQLGSDYMNNQQLDTAEFLFRAALIFNSNSAKPRYNLGWICEEREYFGCASEQYNRVLRNSDNPFVIAYAVSSLSRLQILIYKNPDRALELLHKYVNDIENLKIKTSEKSIIYKNLGWAHFERSSYKNARIYLEKALELDNENVSAYCLLAKLERQAENSKNELELLEKCLLFPENQGRSEVEAWKREAEKRLQSLES